jgi:plastocyanin
MEANAGMNRLNRRRFMALSSAGVASAALVACGNESASDVELNPTMIPDVAGAPPTLAPMASPPSTGSGGDQAADGGEEASGGGAVSVSAFEMGFDPAELQVAPGDTITMTNDGVLEHDFSVDEWGGVLIGPFMGGESGEATVPEDAAVGDTFTFYCSIPGHREAGMEGTITIVEAGAAAAGGEEGATPEEGAAPAGGAIEQVDVSAAEMLFDPAEFEVTPGTKIVVTNDGVLEHDFAVDDWGGVVVGPLAGGDAGEYTVPDDVEAGATIEFYCSIPGHKESGMTGTMTVV